MNYTVINYSNILEGSGLGDIGHLIHGVLLVGVALFIVLLLAYIAYKFWKGDL
jgi:hypothetical protein